MDTRDRYTAGSGARDRAGTIAGGTTVGGITAGSSSGFGMRG